MDQSLNKKTTNFNKICRKSRALDQYNNKSIYQGITIIIILIIYFESGNMAHKHKTQRTDRNVQNTQSIYSKRHASYK